MVANKCYCLFSATTPLTFPHPPLKRLPQQFIASRPSPTMSMTPRLPNRPAPIQQHQIALLPSSRIKHIVQHRQARPSLRQHQFRPHPPRLRQKHMRPLHLQPRRAPLHSHAQPNQRKRRPNIGSTAHRMLRLISIHRMLMNKLLPPSHSVNSQLPIQLPTSLRSIQRRNRRTAIRQKKSASLANSIHAPILQLPSPC